MTDIDGRLRADAARWALASIDATTTPPRPRRAVRRVAQVVAAAAVAGVLLAVGLVAAGGRSHQVVTVGSGTVPTATPPLLRHLETTPEAVLTGNADGMPWRLEVKENATALHSPTLDQGLTGRGLCEEDTWGATSGGSCVDPAQEASLQPWWTAGAYSSEPGTVAMFGVTSAPAASVVITVAGAATSTTVPTVGSGAIAGLRFFFAALPDDEGEVTTLTAVGAGGDALVRAVTTPTVGPLPTLDDGGAMWPIDRPPVAGYPSAVAAGEAFARAGLGVVGAHVGPVGVLDYPDTLLAISGAGISTPVDLRAVRGTDGTWSLAGTVELAHGDVVPVTTGVLTGSGTVDYTFAPVPSATTGVITARTDQGVTREQLGPTALRSGAADVPGRLAGPYFVVLRDPAGDIVAVDGSGL